MLVHSGYDVDAPENGAAAWDALQANRYDLMITDNYMPKLTGIELIKKVRATRLALPVILAAGKFPLEEFTRHPQLQPSVTLLKPYTFDELVGAVQIVLLATAGADMAAQNETHIQKHIKLWPQNQARPNPPFQAPDEM